MSELFINQSVGESLEILFGDFNEEVKIKDLKWKQLLKKIQGGKLILAVKNSKASDD